MMQTKTEPTAKEIATYITTIKDIIVYFKHVEAGTRFKMTDKDIFERTWDNLSEIMKNKNNLVIGERVGIIKGEEIRMILATEKETE